MTIEFVFFDIGGTLGDRDSTSGAFHVFPSSRKLMLAMRHPIGLRIGVITTLGSLTNQQGLDILHGAGLADLLDPLGFVSEHDVEGERGKPDPAIYKFAANKVGVPIERCLFVGENLSEVIGAMTAGMQAVLKPCPPGRDVQG